MTLSTLTLLTAAITALTLNINSVTSQTVDPRLAEELKCLDQQSVDQCNLAVTFQPPVNALACDQLVPESQYVGLDSIPTLQVPTDISPPNTEALLILFDPDAPTTGQPIDGYIHLIAKVVVDQNGYLVFKSTIIEYVKPSPPRGNGPHRYQFFLYISSLDKTITVGPGRTFQLCSFMRNNSLSQPVATFQFKFKRA